MNLTVYENSCPAPGAPEPHDKQVRAFFTGAVDGGHVSGPFTATEAASAATALLSRGDVSRAVIEDAE